MSLLPVKRREKVLVVLASAVALSVFRSAPADAEPAPGLLEGVRTLQTIGIDGGPAQLYVLRGVYEMGRIVVGASLPETIGFSSAVLGVLICILCYFIYRELFAQRYVGVVALALLGSGPAFIQAANGAGLHVVALFFIAAAVYASLTQRWILWGIAAGLAFSSHYASATAVLPWMVWAWSGRSVDRPLSLRMAVGVLVAGAITASLYFPAFTVNRELNTWAALGDVPSSYLGSAPLGLEHIVYIVAYVVFGSALVGYFRGNS